jgi:histidine triad (HIT) family protein
MKQIDFKNDYVVNCVFCRINNRKTSNFIVFEDTFTIAFLDHRPLFPGHLLLIPKDHYETLMDLPNDLILPLFTNAKLLAQVVKNGTGAEGIFIGINNRVSQSVPHLHIHIVPRQRGDGLKGFFWPRHPYQDQKDMEKVQANLKKALKQIEESYSAKS